MQTCWRWIAGFLLIGNLGFLLTVTVPQAEADPPPPPECEECKF